MRNMLIKRVCKVSLFFTLILSVSLLVPKTVDASESGKIGETEWSIDDEGVLTISGEGSLTYNEKWESLSPTGLIVNGFTSIGPNSFMRFSSLKSLELGEGVKYIREGAFANCTNLEKVILPSSLVAINDPEEMVLDYANVFGGCNKLTTAGPKGGEYNIQFSWNTTIPHHAFYRSNTLVSITFPAGITEIGDVAMGGCSNLETVSIPEGVTSLGYCAFRDCSKLKSVSIPSTLVHFGTDATKEDPAFRNVFEECNSITTAGPVGGGYNIEFAWTDSIPKGAFDACMNLTSVTLPDGLTAIDEEAFIACGSLETISFPESLTSIGFKAFENCWSLSSLIIPKSVKTIGENAFSFCTNLTTVEICNGVNTIGSDAFSWCSMLEKIYIPESVKSVGTGTGIFSSCDKLKSAGPKGGNYDIEYEWTDEIPAYAFANSNVDTVVFPNGIKTIGQSAFMSCKNLESIEIPDSVSLLSAGAFNFCLNLKSVSLPKEINIIYAMTFFSCEKLESLVIPENVKTIYNSALTGCSSIKELVFPMKLEKVDDNFSICKSLKKISVYNKDLYNSLIERQKDGTISKSISIEFVSTECIHECEDKIYPATTKADGSIVKVCKLCGKELGREKINRAYVFVDETAKYTGKAIKQPVKVVDCNGKKISSKYYSVTYKNNKKAGSKAGVTIKFKDYYKGTVTKNFVIVKKTEIPAKVTKLTLKAGKKSATVSWKMLTKNVTGYEIQYSEDKNFINGVKTVAVSKASTVSKKVSKLKSKMIYYFRIRAVNKGGKNKTYSAWSSSKKVKIK